MLWALFSHIAFHAASSLDGCIHRRSASLPPRPGGHSRKRADRLRKFALRERETPAIRISCRASSFLVCWTFSSPTSEKCHYIVPVERLVKSQAQIAAMLDRSASAPSCPMPALHAHALGKFPFRDLFFRCRLASGSSKERSEIKGGEEFLRIHIGSGIGIEQSSITLRQGACKASFSTFRHPSDTAHFKFLQQIQLRLLQAICEIGVPIRAARMNPTVGLVDVRCASLQS